MKPAPGLQQGTPIAAPFPVPDSAGHPGRDAGAGRALSPAELGRLVRATARQGGAWRPVVRFTPDRRWFHRLALTADYEIWLLTWLPGQRTGIHDHGDASGAFAVGQGELRETLAAPGSSRIRQRTAVAGSVTSFGGRHLCTTLATSRPLRPLSVHAYSPPLSAMRRYEMTSAGLALARTERGGARLVTRPFAAFTIEEILAAARSRLTRLSPLRAQQAAAHGAVLVDIEPGGTATGRGRDPRRNDRGAQRAGWRFRPGVDGPGCGASYDLHVIVFCSEGYTSSLAAASLQDLGVWRATDLDGGFRAWRAASLPVAGAPSDQ